MWEQMQLIGNQYPWFFSGFAFLLGSCVGSFLNVCIYRIPLDESVIAPGSHCACGKPIAWYDNLPILSWFLLRGRARCCGRRFSPRYPFVEAPYRPVVLGLLAAPQPSGGALRHGLWIHAHRGDVY